MSSIVRTSKVSTPSVHAGAVRRRDKRRANAFLTHEVKEERIPWLAPFPRDTANPPMDLRRKFGPASPSRALNRILSAPLSVCPRGLLPDSIARFLPNLQLRRFGNALQADFPRCVAARESLQRADRRRCSLTCRCDRYARTACVKCSTIQTLPTSSGIGLPSWSNGIGRPEKFWIVTRSPSMPRCR